MSRVGSCPKATGVGVFFRGVELGPSGRDDLGRPVGLEFPTGPFSLKEIGMCMNAQVQTFNLEDVFNRNLHVSYKRRKISWFPRVRSRKDKKGHTNL